MTASDDTAEMARLRAENAALLVELEALAPREAPRRLTPSTPAAAGTSKLNMLGAGPVMLRSIMKAKGVETLPNLIETARGLGVRLIACQMAMDVMGIVPTCRRRGCAS